MPLRDHFRPPVTSFASWEELHGAWPATIAYRLNALLPPEYRSGVKVHLGSRVEVDVGTFEVENARAAGTGAPAGSRPAPPAATRRSSSDEPADTDAATRRPAVNRSRASGWPCERLETTTAPSLGTSRAEIARRPVASSTSGAGSARRRRRKSLTVARRGCHPVRARPARRCRPPARRRRRRGPSRRSEPQSTQRGRWPQPNGKACLVG